MPLSKEFFLQTVNVRELVRELVDPGSKVYQIIIEHGLQVQQKALRVTEHVRHLDPDFDFIFEAAWLHDIGIFMVNAPEIGCTGAYPYICHGYLGRELLEKKGLPRHGLVCETHVGTGITREEIIVNNLPLPKRDMLPLSLEEQIICYADKFFSKSIADELSIAQIKQKLKVYGQDQIRRFDAWVELFN